MKTLLFHLWLAHAWCANPGTFDDQAQPPPPAEEGRVESYREVVQRILKTSLREGQAYSRLARLCEVAPHRLSGSPGAEKAIQWMKQEMESAGFENVRLESCQVPHWVRGSVEELVALGEDGKPLGVSLPILALGGSVPTAEAGLVAEVLEVKSWEELEARKDEVPGRIVFYNRPMEQGHFSTFRAYGGAVDQRSRGAIEAAKLGGVAAVVRSMSTRLDDFPHTGSMAYDDDVERIPGAAVSTLGADRLSRLLATGKPVKLRLKLSCEWFEEKESFNVIGELVGREHPEQVVVVGGHFDAWDVGHGAHDDGGGCIQSFEVVRLLSSLDLKPRRTIRAVMFMNEENGVRGGRAYHHQHFEEMDQHVMALESDRGSFVPRGFTSDANPEAMAVLQEIVGLMEEAGIHLMNPGYGGVDISPMRANGVVTVGLLPDSQRYFDLHHSARDTIDQVSPREINLGAGAMAALCYVVADLPETLRRNVVDEE